MAPSDPSLSGFENSTLSSTNQNGLYGSAKATGSAAEGFTNLWLLADMAFIPRLKNHVMQIFCRVARKSRKRCPDTALLETAYANSTDQSPLRRFLVKAFALRCPAEEFDARIVGLSQEIVFDIAVCLKRYGRTSRRLKVEDYQVPEVKRSRVRDIDVLGISRDSVVWICELIMSFFDHSLRW